QAMLEGYLAFARGEAVEDTGSFDLQHCFATLAKDARLRKRQLETKLEGPAEIQVRPNAFSRLLSNLVDNALRHARKVRVEALNSRGILTITVDDDGPGVPPDKFEEVFTPFFRLDTARNQDSGGTGLGLAIARDIARSHGGDITLAASPLG